MFVLATLAIILVPSSYAEKVPDLELLPTSLHTEETTPRPESDYSLGFVRTAENEAIKCACWPTYSTKKVVPTLSAPHGLCSAPNGDFAVVYWSVQKKFSVYNKNGVLLKQVNLPATSGRMVSCVYAPNQLLLADFSSKKIYKYSTDGKYTYKGVFASGHNYVRMTVGGGHLYVGIPSNTILIYLTNNGKLIHQFKTGGYPRGMAFDSKKQLHVALWNKKIVERYDHSGKKLGQRIYKELNVPDGLAIDLYDNIHISNRGNPSTVTVYSESGILVNTISGFKSVIDAVDQNMKQMIAVDLSTSKATIYR